MRTAMRVILVSIFLALFLIPFSVAQQGNVIIVELSEENIYNLTSETQQTVKAKIFNNGSSSLMCAYKAQASEENLITEGLSPMSTAAFNIQFYVPEGCREPCTIPVHITCYDKASGNLAAETDVSFDLYDIQTESFAVRFGRLLFLLLILGGIGFVLWRFVLRNIVRYIKKAEKEPAQEIGKRKLSAIMFTDMKGYSKEVGVEEEKTLKKVWRYERAMKQIIKEHEGRVVKTIGDAIMGDFDSAVNAVNAALEIQRLLAKEDIKIRIGIHLGDVIHKAGDIFGDGVNIASRIESISEPGEIYISEDVYNQVRGKIAVKFENLGNKRLKNIEVSPRIYKIVK